jgi:membrane protein YdbS with pleckstrin-like domain
MENFTNEHININELPKFEEVILTKIHPSYWKVICINLSIFLGLVAIGLTTLCLFNKEFSPYAWLIALCYLAFAALLFLLYRSSYLKRGYALREKDIIYKSGIIAEKTKIIPRNRIQHVALDEGLFSRIYKLGTLQLNTADGVAGQIRIAGLPIDDAKTIKEALINSIDFKPVQANIEA